MPSMPHKQSSLFLEPRCLFGNRLWFTGGNSAPVSTPLGALFFGPKVALFKDQEKGVRMKSKSALFAVVLGISSTSFAGIWGNYVAGGTSCNMNNVSVIENGNSLSVLFDEFGVNMPQGDVGDGTSARKSCTFRIALTPPNGYYLAGFRQVYSGGIIKSGGSSGQLNIRYNVGSVVGQPLAIVFREREVIRPQDPQSLFSREYYNNLLVANCGGQTNYGINMSFTATRRSTWNEHLMGGLDSVDADFVQRLVLIPDFRLCSRR